jgi:hypothetical protein
MKHMHMDGFETETDLTIHALELQLPVAEVPTPCNMPVADGEG